MNTLTKTFFDLVKIDSPSGEEDALREYLIKRLKKAGINTNIDTAGNLFVSVDGVGGPLLLSCHLDTVEPGRGIKPRIKKGVIESSGDTILGADNKVAVATMLHLLENLPEKHAPIEVVFSVREETDGGINQFDFSQLKSKQGIVADSSTKVGTMITASPWIKDIVIEVIGKSAHSARPEEGRNALTAVSKVLASLTWGRVSETTTANIGIIAGGTGTNTIPEKVRLEGELRSFSAEAIVSQLKHIKDTFEEVCHRENLSMKITVNDYCNGYVLEKTDPAILKLSRVFAVNSIQTHFKISHGGSDANAFNDHGITVVNIGDGSKNAHTVDECIEVKELERLFEVIECYVSI